LTAKGLNDKIKPMERKKKPKIIASVSILCLAFLFILALVGKAVFAADSTDDANDQQLQENISDVQKKIQAEEQKRLQLMNQLNQIQGSVSKTQSEINATHSFIKETEESISRKAHEIELLNEKMTLQKVLLSGLLREMYYSRTNPVEKLIVGKSSMSPFLGEAENYLSVQQKITEIIQDLKTSKTEIEGDTASLKENQEEHERLLGLKQDQQQTLLAEKSQTQLSVQQKDATIAELQAKLYKLRSELSGFLGKTFNAKDIEDAASFASKVSGVRKDFIMGMLVVESDLGRFTGGCYAKDSRMSGNRLSLFKDICSSLGYKWEKQKVSCPPRGYTGTGGAMGVAQFMSDTWTGYKNQITSVTGHKPPDPWNLTDGVVAMGLKLARGGASSRSGECSAAKLYLSGTTSSKYNWYCDKVKYWADNYERLLD